MPMSCSPAVRGMVKTRLIACWDPLMIPLLPRRPPRQLRPPLYPELLQLPQSWPRLTTEAFCGLLTRCRGIFHQLAGWFLETLASSQTTECTCLFAPSHLRLHTHTHTRRNPTCLVNFTCLNSHMCGFFRDSSGASIVCDKGIVSLCGGRTPTGEVLDDLYTLDLATHHWTCVFSFHSIDTAPWRTAINGDVMVGIQHCALETSSSDNLEAR